MNDLEKMKCVKYLLTLAEKAKDKCDAIGATCILYVTNMLLDTIKD